MKESLNRLLSFVGRTSRSARVLLDRSEPGREAGRGPRGPPHH